MLLILITVLAAWLAAGDKAGKFIADKIIAPLKGSGNTVPSPTALAAEPAVTPDAAGSGAGKITRQLKYDSFNIHAIQLGVFSMQENAVYQAQAVKSRGAAGYILTDNDMYRVLATVFFNRDDAVNVKDNLIENQGIDACVKDMAVAELALTITSEESNIVYIDTAIKSWLQSARDLSNLDRGFDSGLVTRTQAMSSLLEIQSSLDNCNESLKGLGADNRIIQSMQEELGILSGELEALNDSSLSDASFSSQLKYVLIDVLWRYGNFASSIK